MQFELTDILTCPRCGPRHGLVLLVRQAEGGRVASGWLGCPNCRTDYAIEAGTADLRLDREGAAPAESPLQGPELALKVVALTGVREARGYLLLDEALGHVAADVLDLAPEIEVLVLAPAPGAGTVPGVSRIASDAGLPFREFGFRGVALVPRGRPDRVDAGARRVAAGGRLVLFDARAADVAAAEAAGLTLLAVEEGTAVAERSADSLTG